MKQAAEFYLKICISLILILALSDSILKPAFAKIPVEEDYPLFQAQSFLDQKKALEAVNLLTRAIEINPSDKEILLALSKAHIFLGDRQKSLDVIRRHLSTIPKKDEGGLRDRIRVIARLFLTNETFKIYLEGLNLLQLDRYDPAIKKLKDALDREPDNIEILLRLGQSYLLLDKTKEAVGFLEKASNISPDEPEVKLWLGRALFKLSQVPLAGKLLSFASTSLPKSELASAWYSELLDTIGKREEAILFLEHKAQENPHQLRTLYNLSRYYYLSSVQSKKKGNLKKALKFLHLVNKGIEEYSQPGAFNFESELGLALKNSDGLRQESDALMKEINRIIK